MKISLNLKVLLSKVYFISVITLWMIQVPIYNYGIPLYFILAPFLIAILGLRVKDIKVIIILYVSMLSIFILQNFQDIELVYMSRVYGALIFLPIVLIVTIKSLLILINESEKQFVLTIKACVYIVFCLMVFQYILWVLNLYDTRYQHLFLNIPIFSGPYSEPSHLAMSLSPAIFLSIRQLILRSRDQIKMPRIIMLATFLLAPSLTFILVAIFSLIIITIELVKLKKKPNSIFYISTLLFFTVGISYLFLQSDYFASRIDGVISLLYFNEDSRLINLSALVFFKGFQMAMLAISDYPLGVGILNMAFLSPFVEASYYNDLLYDLNSNDGSSMLFKVISEFGYFGIGFITTAVFYCIRLLLKNQAVYSAIIFGFIASFIRGASYFDGAPIIAISLLLILILKYKPNIILLKTQNN